jgi:methionyl-tRNA synthetase
MSTGTDEHGLKVRREGVHSELMFFIVSYASDIISNSTVYMIQVQQAAEAKGISPQEWCDETSDQFKKLFLKAGISYDDYIRTTEPRHKIVVEHMWKILEVRRS